MTAELRKHIEDYAKEHCGYDPNIAITDSDILEILQEEDTIYEEHVDSHRWWEEWLNVVKIGDKFIGYFYGRANRDESVEDLGYEFDIKAVAEYICTKETKTVDVWKLKI